MVRIPHQELKQAGVDVAGIVTEDFLNHFSERHHAHGATVYKGRRVFDNLSSRVAVAYDVKNPITFSLRSIKSTQFRRLWCSHLVERGATSLTTADIHITPPNLEISTKKVRFTITVYKGHTNNVDFEVDFVWDLRAVCAVIFVDSGGGKKAVRLDPLRVEFSKGHKVILREIRQKLQKLGLVNRLPVIAEGTGHHATPLRRCSEDPTWCEKLESLVLFLVNEVLALQVGNFVREWDLPLAIELIGEIKVEPTFLSISNKLLIVGGQVVYDFAGGSPLQAKLDAVLIEFERRAEEEFATMSDSELEKWKPERSPTIQWLQGMEKVERKLAARATRVTKRAAKYDENLLLLSNDKMFDALAKKYLTIRKGWAGSKKLDFVVKGEAGWWFTVENGKARVIPRGVHVEADVKVGAYARACFPNPDPKHWGEWACVGLEPELRPHPDFSMNAFPVFAGSGVFLNLALLTQQIRLRFRNLPGWANKIIGWISGMLTVPLLNLLRWIIAQFYFKVVDYPAHFPGTALDWTPRINRVPRNAGPYLVFSGDPRFQ